MNIYTMDLMANEQQRDLQVEMRMARLAREAREGRKAATSLTRVAGTPVRRSRIAAAAGAILLAVGHGR